MCSDISLIATNDDLIYELFCLILKKSDTYKDECVQLHKDNAYGDTLQYKYDLFSVADVDNPSGATIFMGVLYVRSDGSSFSNWHNKSYFPKVIKYLVDLHHTRSSILIEEL